MGWCKVGLCNFGGVLVSLKRLIGRLLSLVANSELSEVTMVVTLPMKMDQSREIIKRRVHKHLVVENL